MRTRSQRGRGGSRARDGTARASSSKKALQKKKQIKRGKAAMSKKRKLPEPPCPISLEPIGAHHFKFVRPNGSTQSYNIKPLVEYLLSTGVFAEPVSRIEFTESDLQKIDTLAAKKGRFESVLKAKKEKTEHYSNIKWRRQVLHDLDNCCGASITKTIEYLESLGPRINVASPSSFMPTDAESSTILASSSSSVEPASAPPPSSSSTGLSASRSSPQSSRLLRQRGESRDQGTISVASSPPRTRLQARMQALAAAPQPNETAREARARNRQRVREQQELTQQNDSNEEGDREEHDGFFQDMDEIGFPISLSTLMDEYTSDEDSGSDVEGDNVDMDGLDMEGIFPGSLVFHPPLGELDVHDFRNDPRLREYLSEFADFFLQMASMDKEHAVQCGKQYVTFLQGPPNRPTKDRRGYLPSILSFLKMQSSQLTNPNNLFMLT